MADASFLDWPFLEARHRDWAAEVEAWAARHAEALSDEHDPDGSTARLARAMGEAGLLRVPCPEDGGSMSAPSASRATSWRGMRASPISPSPCRASAPAP
jgi:alkylation response protein AidB-like acyl-CoA dehydrogenase